MEGIGHRGGDQIVRKTGGAKLIFFFQYGKRRPLRSKKVPSLRFNPLGKGKEVGGWELPSTATQNWTPFFFFLFLEEKASLVHKQREEARGQLAQLR